MEIAIISGLLVLVATLAGALTQHMLQRTREKYLRSVELRSKIYGTLSSKISLLASHEHWFFTYSIQISADVGTEGEERSVRLRSQKDVESLAKRPGGVSESVWRSPRTYAEKMHLVEDIQTCIGEALLYAQAPLQAKLMQIEDLLYSESIQLNHEDENPSAHGVDIFFSSQNSYLELRDAWQEALVLMREELGR